jgi:hypothetical protein
MAMHKNTQLTQTERDDLDRPLWGAEPIGREAGLFDENGDVDLRKTYYLLERGYLPGTKIGRLWTSTPRRLRRRFAGETA